MPLFLAGLVHSAVSLGVLEHSLRSGVVPGALNAVHLFDEVTLADDVVGHVARAGEATKVLQVDGILAGYVVFDYSVKASVSGDDMSDETQMAKRREQNTGCKTQMAKRNRKRNGKA